MKTIWNNKMSDEKKKICLTDLIDINFLQNLQDNFAKTIGVASLVVDDKGPITKPTNFTNFCTNFIRASELGLERCNKCDIQGGKLAIEKGEPVIYTCHAGLTHFVVPIIVAGEHLASIVGGQISLETPDEKHFKAVAKELGIKDDDKYLKALGEIHVLSEEKIKTAIQLLFLVANSVSEIAHKTYELLKKNQKEKISKNIIEKIRGTLEPEEIKNYFVDITQRYFDADRCIFADYDANTGKFIPFSREKLKSPDMESLINVDLEEVFPEFCAKLIKGRNIIIKDLEKTLSRKSLLGYKSVKALRDSDIKSDYGLIVQYRGQIIGILIIHYINEKRILTHEELDFLKYLREQAGTALYQAKLYNATQELAKREVLLRNITETIRQSLNFDETKKIIINIIGETLNADRCFILEYNKAKDRFLIVNEEYLSSDSVLGYKGVDLNEHIPSLAAELKKGTRLIINVGGVILNGEKVNLKGEEFEDVRKSIEKYKVKSALVFPLFYSDEFLGDLVLHYVKVQHEIGNDEVEFLTLISSQIALALHQSKLYEKIQLQAEREKISRNIIEILRSTLDKNMIEHLFVRNIGKYFSADRVFFSEFDKKENIYLPIDEKSEYLSNPGEKSFACLNLFDTNFGGHFQPLLDKRELIIPNWEGYIENYTKTSELIDLYKEANVKSTYSFPVLHEGRIMGYFCIEFTHKINELMDEDINRLRSICTQAGIALYHAELYLEAQKALQAKGELIVKVQNGIKEPVENIMESSKILSEQQLEREKQQKYLSNIINSCNKLMELTKDISDDV